MRAGTMPDFPRLSLFGVVPVVVLLLLASVTGGVGADEGDKVSSSSSSSPSWWHGPDPPEGEPTEHEREMFHERTPSCIVCQRAVHYLDENLLVKILDERAKDRSVNDPANYGRIEAIVEDEVSKVCSASGIQLDKKLRQRCNDMLERYEDALVRAWYDRSSQDDDWNMNWRICAKKHGLLKVCPTEIARFDVPQLDHLEQEVKLEELRSPVREGGEGGRKRVRYQTQAGRAKLAQRQRLSRSGHSRRRHGRAGVLCLREHAPEDAQGDYAHAEARGVGLSGRKRQGEAPRRGERHRRRTKRNPSPVRQPRQGSDRDTVPGRG